MTTLRSISADEKDLFSEGETAEKAASLRAYVDAQLEAGSIRPEWCFVAERDGAQLGRAALYALPGADVPASIALLETSWEDADAGPEVLRLVAARARDLGAAALEYALDTPPSAPRFQFHPAEQEAALRAAGFRLLRDGMRWRWTTDAPVPPQDDRLTFRPLPEIGRETFVDVLGRTMEGTADADLADGVAAHGLHGAGEWIFDLMAKFDHRDEWYEIGFAPDGSPAAVSMPARNPSEAVIGHVGVVPEHRRRGYATAVVARGVAVLAAAGATSVVGDCDAANTGIARAFAANGFDNFVNRREFGRSLG
ncbi:GNAT family N-acetyltransferase [Promicromonospora sp. NPDC057138]|uniref:GNAT family N-acetyltransferase n=1 Tax=Promicromonospora sp. NPDC057138 TaxID=3346031 RepID=UPI0036436A31